MRNEKPKYSNALLEGPAAVGEYSPMPTTKIRTATSGGYWERLGVDGSCFTITELRSHPEGKWTEVGIIEHGRKSTKEAHVTLNEEQARILYRHLKTVFEPTAK